MSHIVICQHSCVAARGPL